MSELQPSPREAVLSTALEDLTVPGVVIEVDPDEAEANGAFRETALSEADAWESNGDSEGGEQGE